MRAPILAPASLAERTPPGLLPVGVGLLAAGLGWRAAGSTLGAPVAVGEIWLGASGALFAFLFTLSLRRALARPGRLARDLRMPAGRGATPAGPLGLLLCAAALEPVSPLLATPLWAGGVILHVYIAAALLKELADMPPSGRPATASLLTPFAGQMAAPLAGAALGFGLVSTVLFWSGVAVWAALAPLSLRRLARKAAPPPYLRPGVTTLLTPPALGALAAERLDPGGGLAAVFLFAGAATLFGLLARLRWLTAGGWSLGWGAFAPPVALASWACVEILTGRGAGLAWDWTAALALALASLATLWIAMRAFADWGRGRLPQG